ncbi:MAG: hypothetical protein AAF658_15200 [Myxococcota bacterium]
MRFRIALLLVAAVALGGCDDTDIGNECPQLLEQSAPASDGTEGRSETQEIVGISALFPCDDLICIATDGIAGYCSRRCRSDAACPSAFECRTVQPIGEFANDQFCAWRQCASDGDCGDTETYCCRDVDGVDPVNEVRLCGFRDTDC